MPPLGLEEPSSNTGNTRSADLGGNAGGNGLAELAELWPSLSDAGRSKLLAIACKMVSQMDYQCDSGHQ